jgi:diguanylate cyclase (GGDEF)-like protein
LICGEEIPADIIHEHSHTLCQLGQWYYGERSTVFSDYPEFIAIEKIHREMHDKAREIVLHFKTGEKTPAEEYRLFIQRQQELIGLLQSLRDKLLITLHSYDELTGAIRRESLSVLSNKVHAYSVRNSEPYTVAMADLDHFKKVNDTYGHLAGDKVLQQIAHLFIHRVREEDAVCRYGGEEFLLLLPRTKKEEAIKFLEDIRRRIEQAALDIGNEKTISITTSIGIAEWEPGLSFEEVVRHSDKALYRAKNAGRNQIIMW